MAEETMAVETGHGGMIHDAQLDYYGKRLATASADRTVKVFDVSEGDQGGAPRLVGTLTGHEGPVWQVAWAHPKYGSLLATAGFDRRVIVWKEQQAGQWQPVHEYRDFQGSVNSVAWAAEPLGLVLAAGSADGPVAVLTYRESERQWHSARFPAHAGGVNAVSWAPSALRASVVGAAGGGQQEALAQTRQLVTGGCDNLVKVWQFSEQRGQWETRDRAAFEGENNAHGDWVRDVAWAPSMGLPVSTIASCSEDRTVAVWTEERGVWRKQWSHAFPDKVWRVSWSVMGNVLAVSQGNNKVSLWKEGLDGRWNELTSLADEGKEL